MNTKTDFRNHGTFKTYSDGCLCDRCWEEAERVHKARRGQTVHFKGNAGKTKTVGPVDLSRRTHGKRGTYLAGCHCEACTEASRVYHQRRRAQRMGF